MKNALQQSDFFGPVVYHEGDCILVPDLMELALGKLQRTEIAYIERHAATCAQCKERLEAFRRADQAIKEDQGRAARRLYDALMAIKPFKEGDETS